MFHFDFQVCFWINETNRLDMDVGGFCQLSKLVWKMEKGEKTPTHLLKKTYHRIILFL